MMMSDSELLSIKQELLETSHLDAFIVKYHTFDQPEVRYLIIYANWKKIEEDKELSIQIPLLKKFIIQNRATKDNRVKRLVALSIEKLLRISPEMPIDYQYDLCNEIIELCQSIESTDLEASHALIYAYWHKGKQLEDKDLFKANYFYNRIISLSQNIQERAFIQYKLKAQSAKVDLSLRTDEHAVDNIVEILSGLPEYELDQDVQMVLLELIHHFLVSLNGVHRDLDVKAKVKAIEQIIDTKKLLPLLNAVEGSELVCGILHYMTFIFWLDQNVEKTDLLVHQYLQSETRDLSQIIDNNYNFQISDDVEIEDFNEYISTQYEQFAQRQKYRKMFKVAHKPITL